MPDGRLAGALAALVLGVAACGGGGGPDRADVPRTPPEPSETPPDVTVPEEADPESVRVVRAWADTLRRGDVRGAARYFAVPSRVSNGTPAITLKSRAAARFFNRTLPCGAEVIGSEPAPHDFVYITFRLTERPGRGRCGAGTGGTARTAFRVRDGHITDWLRVPDDQAPPGTLS